ncbi:MAG: 1-acyl-sn-glycerol-3-phosphate acyltransferase [Jatrophihabitantaceae bacterium]
MPPRLVRRVVVDPLWLPVALTIGVLLGIVVIISLLAPITPKKRALRASCLALVYLYVDVRLMLVALAFWLRHPRRAGQDAAWTKRHAELLGRALDQLMSAAGRLFGYAVDLVGRELRIEHQHPLVVLARHAGPGDSFTLVHLLVTTYHRVPRVVLKQTLQWDPGLDVVLTRLDCHFLPSKSGAGEDRAVAIAETVNHLVPGDAMLLFPEGSNWTPRRHRRSVIALRRSGHVRKAREASARTHVLPPHPRGTVAALTARDDTDVLVVAHAGLDTLVNPGQMWAALPLRNRPMRIRAWLRPAGEVPREASAITSWLEDQWADVDQWVATERRYGDE